MSAYRVFGNRLVPEKELMFRRAELQRARAAKASFLFSGGAVPHADLVAAPAHATGVPMPPIGPGLPLTVEVMHLYTGQYPKLFIGSRAPMLLTSSLKNLGETGANARAVNFLVKSVSSRRNLATPAADQQGTPLVCYVPAVTSISTTITFNLVFQNFPDEVFAQLGALFSGAASVPLFLSARPYLVGAGVVLKLAQDIGDVIFNGRPDFDPTFVVNFDDIGAPSQAGYVVLFKDENDADADPTKMNFVAGKGLVDPGSGEPYSGPAPYIVVGIDGKARDALKNFAPLAASADLLGRFFNIAEGAPVPLSDMLSAMKAISDITYRRKAESVKKQLDSASDAAARDALQKQLKAYLDNIQDPDLKPAGLAGGAASGGPSSDQ